jgi:hypothetical protein
VSANRVSETRCRCWHLALMRLAASRGSGTGWAAYDEQYRLRKARYPHTPWGDIDMELWLLRVKRQRFLNLVHTNRGATKWIKVRVICYYITWRDGPLRNLNICVHIYTGRVAGPFDYPPMPTFRVSQFFLVRKKNRDFRLIHNLSYPTQNSVNDFIDPEFCNSKMRTINNDVTSSNGF